MAGFKANEEARRNRLASMTDVQPQVEPVVVPRANQFQGRTQLREACLIRLDRIVADPNQPRGEFDADALERLAGSLRQRGQLQPIRVRWDEANQQYVIVIGERRWRAAKLAGMESMACIVVPGTATPEEILEDQLVENCLREDLKPIEQARAYQSLMHRLGLSQRALAEKLDVSQGQIMQSLKLLELPEPIRESIDDGKIAPSIGYEIAKVTDPGQQLELAEKVARGTAGRAEIRERTVRAPRPKRWGCTLDDGSQVVVTIPGGEASAAEVVERLQKAIKRARGESAQSRPDAA
jgi:ParB family transcriptional regulator, chromosome partitioning protein